jgi:hypothetical protein
MYVFVCIHIHTCTHILNRICLLEQAKFVAHLCIHAYIFTIFIHIHTYIQRELEQLKQVDNNKGQQQEDENVRKTYILYEALLKDHEALKRKSRTMQVCMYTCMYVYMYARDHETLTRKRCTLPVCMMHACKDVCMRQNDYYTCK